MNKILSIFLSAGMLLTSGCNDFFDINDDPNNPTEASVNLLLTNTEITLVNSLGMSTSGLSAILSVYMHQMTRRQGFDAYNVQGTDFPITQSWSQFYSIALEDIREMKNIGTEQEAWHYVGIAQILEAYSYSQMV
ncbi:MAG: SusD/RagB family nutrient-binding outer membrane lipoprotein, partial [Bacteroidota bacterium]